MSLYMHRHDDDLHSDDGPREFHGLRLTELTDRTIPAGTPRWLRPLLVAFGLLVWYVVLRCIELVLVTIWAYL